MMNETNEPQSNLDYVRWRWGQLPAQGRRTLLISLGILLVLWVIGAAYAYYEVTGVTRMDGAARSIIAAASGLWGLGWWWLENQQIVRESSREPHLLWWLGFAVQNGLLVWGGVLLSNPLSASGRNRYRQGQHRQSQGHLSAEEAAGRLAIEDGVPLATVGPKETIIGVDYRTGQGHILVVGPTRAGKGWQLSQTLCQWPGPVICVDPKGEQFERTYLYRDQHGPIYQLPTARIDLARYYNLNDGDDLAELHYHLLKPWQSREPIFANKAKALFQAVALYAQAHSLNPIRVLLDAAESDPREVLHALATVARRHVLQFTNGLPVEAYVQDRFATSAYGTFSTMLSDYQKHVATIAPDPSEQRTTVPLNWAAQNGTLFLNYSLNDLRGVDGVVAAVIAGLLRYQVKHYRPGQPRLLVAIDELPAVGLANINTYLATVGGYGTMMLLYTQGFAQLRQIYGQDGAQALMGNTRHVLWYPPGDSESAEIVSKLYGTELQVSRTHSRSRQPGTKGTQERDGVTESLQVRPALEPAAAMSLPANQVVVQTEADRQYRFIGRRLEPFRLFQSFRTPLPPPPASPPRPYTPWARPTASELPPGGLSDNGGSNGRQDDLGAFFG